VLFLIDEDVDVSVGAFLADRHEVRYVVSVLGSGTLDADVVAYARSEKAVLVTSDRPLAARLRQRKQCACLFLKDLGTNELNRVTQLRAVIEQELLVLGDAFWMQVSSTLYLVAR
jgi:predicted nuclease of predicted toxin-antitoxin system